MREYTLGGNHIIAMAASTRAQVHIIVIQQEPEPESTGNSHSHTDTSRVSCTNLPEKVVLIGDSHTSQLSFRNLPEDVAYITGICYHTNTCSLINLPRSSDN